jgi:hypothetical protein
VIPWVTGKYHIISFHTNDGEIVDEDVEYLPGPDVPVDGDDPFGDTIAPEVALRIFQLQDHYKTEWVEAIKEATARGPLMEQVKSAHGPMG